MRPMAESNYLEFTVNFDAGHIKRVEYELF